MFVEHSFKYNAHDTIQMNPSQQWSKYLKELTLTSPEFRDFLYNTYRRWKDYTT